MVARLEIGDCDVATPPHFSEEMVAGIPNATLHRIPDAGHTSPVEEPTAVLDVMNQFLVSIHK